MMVVNGFVIAVSGAFIATIGAWAAESSSSKRTAIFFKIIGGLFVAIGIGVMLFGLVYYHK